MSTQISTQLNNLTASLGTALGYSVDPAELLANLKATAFKSGNTPITDAHMMQLLLIANQYGLNPWTKEIYAFASNGGIQPIVSVDGWTKIINNHPQLDGFEFEVGGDFKVMDANSEAYTTCIMYRKDRKHPIKVTEYLSECFNPSSVPWKKWAKRMLRHKALIQAARLAFGFSGIIEPDEYERGDFDKAIDVTPKNGGDAFKVPKKPKASIEAQIVDAPPSVIEANPEETEKAITACNNKITALGYEFEEIAELLGLAYDQLSDMDLGELRQLYVSLKKLDAKPL